MPVVGGFLIVFGADPLKGILRSKKTKKPKNFLHEKYA